MLRVQVFSLEVGIRILLFMLNNFSFNEIKGHKSKIGTPKTWHGFIWRNWKKEKKSLLIEKMEGVHIRVYVLLHLLKYFLEKIINKMNLKLTIYPCTGKKIKKKVWSWSWWNLYVMTWMKLKNEFMERNEKK